MFAENKLGSYMIGLSALFWVGYLAILGISFANSLPKLVLNYEPYHIISGYLPVLLAVDFLLRFGLQKTPAQQIKPFLVLPIKRKNLINAMLYKSLFHWFNFIWLSFLIPFALLTVSKFYGLGGALFYSLGLLLLFWINNFWYILCKTLMQRNTLWLLLPLAIYGTIGLLLFLPDKSVVFTTFVYIGDYFIQGNTFTFIGTLTILLLLFFLTSLNFKSQIYVEIGYTDSKRSSKLFSSKRNSSTYNTKGKIKSQLWLLKQQIVRNSNPRGEVIGPIIIYGLFIALLFFKKSNSLNNFFIPYIFIFTGYATFIQGFAYEGNYIERLFITKEGLYNTLLAKYIVYTSLLLIPLGLGVILTFFNESITLQFILLCAFTCSGICNPINILLGIRNKKSRSLNKKVSADKNQINILQGLALGFNMLIALTLPQLMLSIDSYWTIFYLVVTILITITPQYWLPLIYNQLIKKKYTLLEGFRNTRES